MDKVHRTLAVLLGVTLLMGSAALLAGCTVTDVPMRIIFGPTPDAVETQQAIVRATRDAGSPVETPAAPAAPTLAPSTTPTPSRTPTATVTATPTETPTPTPSPTPTVCRYDVALEEAFAPADGATLAPGAEFVAVWRLRNAGNCPWTEGFALAHVDGRRLGAPASVETGALAPGAVLEVSVPMVAPEEEGEYAGAWRMRTDRGDYIGEPLALRIVVAPEAGATPGPVAHTRP